MDWGVCVDGVGVYFSFEEMGGKRLRLRRAEGPPPHLFERDFLKKFFCKNMNSVSHPVGSRVSKNVVLTCAEIYSCKISEAVLNR